MDNYTDVPGSVEIYYPRGATVFASVCAVLFSIVGVTGEYNALKSHDECMATANKSQDNNEVSYDLHTDITQQISGILE